VCVFTLLSLPPSDTLVYLGEWGQRDMTSGEGTGQQAVEPVREVTIPDAIRLGIQAFRAGDSKTARTIFERVLALVPDHPDALHFLGVALWADGERVEGVAYVERSVALQPQMTDWRSNLANMLVFLDRIEEAKAMYERVIAEAPDHANAWCNLALVQRLQDAPEAAEKTLRHVLGFAPDNADAHRNLGKLLVASGKIAEATTHIFRAIAIEPARAGGSYALLSRAHLYSGDREKALQVLNTWCSEEPDNPVPRHYLAAASEGPAPARADDGYVEASFDNYATSFDASLARLGYRAPELIAAALDRAIGERSGLVGLDAGCGTGLLGPLVARHFARLDGVDLSEKMMLQARTRGTYAALRHAELTADITAHPATYDVILSADTLCYFGLIDEVAKASYASLRPGGYLAFSVERDKSDAPGPGYRLQVHGRYCHREEYLRAALQSAGFDVVELAEDVLRREAGLPVDGYIVLARRG
jgi:predicted TPR repeat methyltransferase